MKLNSISTFLVMLFFLVYMWKKERKKTQNYIYSFHNLSLGFILKIFLKFRKFQSYSYKDEKV